MAAMQKRHNTIKIKVIGWFLLAALAVLLTGIISYTSYRELLNSLDNDVTQETKLKALGDILANITEAEAKMRAYALTKKPETLETYQQLVLSINQDLERVKTIEPVSPRFNVQVDSVSSLLNHQTSGIASFIELKNTLNQLSFSAKALEEISSTTDSIPSLRTTTTTTTTTTRVDPVVEEPDEDDKRKNTKRQQRRRVQEVAKALSKLEQEPQIETETTIITDTSFVQPDTVLENIQQILVDISKEENRYQQIVANKELKLIESNIMIIDQIRGLISSLEKQELADNIERANNAKLIASRSTLTISIIIFVCLILGILFTYWIFRDVRIRDFYNKQLIGAKQQAEQLADSKQQFLANMSHEIRTPLNSIIGFTEQLAGTDLQPAQQKYLSAVQASSKHLLNTVNDILDYSKIEAGELKIGKIPFELKSVLEEVTNALQLKAREKNLTLNLTISPDKPANLLGDPFRLKQILFNLVNNAIKFTEQGKVSVSCKYHVTDNLSKVVLIVKDTGIGIPREKRNEIFHDFKQVDLSATRRYEGTGLGLAISKRLVEMQGGTIQVKSNDPQGSVFVVKLEYALDEANLADSRVNGEQKTDLVLQSEVSTDLKGIKLLIADDDQFNIQLIQTILEKSGAEISYCVNGAEAIEKIRAHSFDLLLTDINMPEISGVELSRMIRALPDTKKQTIPIIALTANVMENDLERYQKAGINDFVLKPFREEELFNKIRAILPTASLKSPETLYRLDDFEKFAAGDSQALKPMLETFHARLSQNMNDLLYHSKNQEYKTVAELAHKMISSFGHLHAMEPVQKLRLLENQIRSDHQDVCLEEIVNEIEALAIPVLEGLKNELDSLN